MTINRSQGQSLNYVGLYLSRTVFSHGHLYVAISRVKRKKGLTIVIYDKENQTLKSTSNVVFKEVLERYIFTYIIFLLLYIKELS